MRYDIEIQSDHFQILMGDRVRGPLVDTTDLWKKNEKVATVTGAPEFVAIATARYGGKFRIQVEVLSSEPEPSSSSSWSEMGSFELELGSGELLIFGPEADDLRTATTIRVTPGVYVGRAFSRGTDAVDDELAVEGPDEYRVVLWRRTRNGN